MNITINQRFPYKKTHYLTYPDNIGNDVDHWKSKMADWIGLVGGTDGWNSWVRGGNRWLD